jgi:hypothetical protein
MIQNTSIEDLQKDCELLYNRCKNKSYFLSLFGTKRFQTQSRERLISMIEILKKLTN